MRDHFDSVVGSPFIQDAASADRSNFANSFGGVEGQLYSAGFDLSGTNAAPTKPIKTADISDEPLNVDAGAINTVQAGGAAPGASVNYQATQDQAAAVEASVNETHQQVSSALEAGLKATNPEIAGQIMNQVSPNCGPSKAGAAATMCDPSGIAGSLATIMNEIYAYAKHVGDQDILDAAIEAVQYVAQSEEFAPEIREAFIEFEPQQILDYVQTPPELDPAVQEARQKAHLVREAEMQQEAYQARVDAGENLTAADLADLEESSNTLALQELQEQYPANALGALTVGHNLQYGFPLIEVGASPGMIVASLDVDEKLALSQEPEAEPLVANVELPKPLSMLSGTIG